MKVIHVQEIADELNIEYKVVFNETIEIINQLRAKNFSASYLIDDRDKKDVKIFSISSSEIDLITSGQDKKLCIMDLARKLSASAKEVNCLISQLFLLKIISKDVYEYYFSVKNKPSVDVEFQPKEITVGQNSTLKIYIYTECEILDPKILVNSAALIKIEEEKVLPSKMLQGQYVHSYKVEPISHGQAEVVIGLGGTINNVEANLEKLAKAVLKIRPKTPELVVTCAQPRVNALLFTSFGLFIEIFNKGNGTAQNVSIEGLDKYEMFELFEPTKIGNLPHLGKLRYRLSMRAKRSGIFEFNNLFVWYEDLEGRKFESKIPKFEVNVRTPRPELRIELSAPIDAQMGQHFSIATKLTNVGEGEAKNIFFILPIDPKTIKSGVTSCSIPRLKAGFSEKVETVIEPRVSSNFEFKDFVVNYEDIEGKILTKNSNGLIVNIKPSEKPKEGSEQNNWPFTEGKIIGGQYKIIKEIGEGSSSKVYLVKRTRVNEEWALKALKPEYVSNERMTNNFLSEIKVRLLKEEHIVDIIQVDIEKSDDGTSEFPYIIMEYFKGGTLRDKLDLGELLNLNECMYIFNDISQALLTAHQKGYAHFDIKPSNIFFDNQKNLWKLGDFGLGMIIDEDEQIKDRGTLPYMAPELREGKGSIKSDIFSLGKVFREILTGSLVADFAERERSCINSSEREKLRKFRDLIDNMLEKDPEKRPAINEVYKILVDNTWLGTQN